VDGQVLQIHLGNQTIEIGLPCNGQGDCTDEPAGVVALRMYLNDLTTQLQTRPPCGEL
jgi:hypothetical protein